MKSSIILSAVVLFGTAQSAITLVGCYQSTTGTTFKAKDDFNTEGSCAKLCPTSAVIALTNQYSCWCGDSLPNKANKVDDSKCNLTCPGWKPSLCGGKNGYFSYYDTGIANALPEADEPDVVSSSTESSTSTSTAAPATSASAAPQKTTVVVTPSASASATSAPEGKKSNVAAIAAGVVVGVLAIAGVMGGLFFFMRNKKRRAIEDEHRRNATINSFTKPPLSSAATSFNDTRLDPVMAHRRMSDGSIADNQDYSRRILKVTNA